MLLLVVHMFNQILLKGFTSNWIINIQIFANKGFFILVFFCVEKDIVSKNFEFIKQSHLFKFVITSEAWVLKFRCLLCFKVSKFSKETAQLNKDHKYFFIIWSISCHKSLKAPIIFYNRIILKLLKKLPILRKLMLCLWIVKYTEHLNT